MTGVIDHGQRVNVTIDSPVGPLTLVAERGALTGLYMSDQRHRPPGETLGSRLRQVDSAEDAALFTSVERQLAAYFNGTLTSFDVPLNLIGTTFQQQVWQALCGIAHGETISYGELARRVGQPGAARAVGMANGRNPIGIIVPCHRVIGANGSMTGYDGGLDRKRFLLDLEKRRGEALRLFD